MFSTLGLLSLLTGSAHAQWMVDGTPVCVASNGQSSLAMTTDGLGGAIMCWIDGRGGEDDIYVQRISSLGVAEWMGNGVPICIATGKQENPQIVRDGVGGAIVVWADERDGLQADDIYVQRVSAAGIAMWQNGGVLVCNAANEQRSPVVATDDAGGVIIAWEDDRAGAYDSRVYAQRVDASGNVCLAPGGIALANTSAWQSQAQVVSDGLGGAIVVWGDFRSGGDDGDLYGQRVNASGGLLWGAGGTPVCTYFTQPTNPFMIPDGSGGAIVAWVDRFGVSWEQSDIYAQRIEMGGSLLWAVRGVALSNTPSSDQIGVVLATDGAGGAIAAWTDWGGNGLDIYAQRVNAAGTPTWTINGVPICSPPGSQRNPATTTDGAGGAIVAWQDDSPGIDYSDVRAGRIDPFGSVLWGSAGIPISTANNEQQYPVIVADGGGGAIVAWSDQRDETVSAIDVYAQRVGPDGLIPTAVRGGSAVLSLVVSPGVPNPFSWTTVFDLHLNRTSNVDVRVYDVRGRLVERIALGTITAGVHQLEFDGRDREDHLLPSGVYFCQVTAGGETLVRKMVIAR